MELLTSGGRQSQPARSHFQPAWSPTPAKPAGKQNTDNSKQQGGNLDSIADILQGLKQLLWLSVVCLAEWVGSNTERMMPVFQTHPHRGATVHLNMQNSVGCKAL